MRNRYFNIRDTWDIACATTFIGAVYAAFVSIFMPNGPLIFPMVFGLLLTFMTPLMLAYCALPGWWLMQLSGQRLRSHQIVASGMAGLVIGFLVAMAWLAVIIVSQDLKFPFARTTREYAMFGILTSIPMAYTMVASLFGALRWRHLEKREVV